ncbi:MAG TPA: YjfB family protein [Accumulibacter sp.]|nr:YjfB family protein [Accumulibacter sp.]
MIAVWQAAWPARQAVTEAENTRGVDIMEVSAIAALATELSQTRNAGAVQLAVLRKAMAIQEENAQQLIDAASQVVSNNPPHLGNRVDTSA